MGSLALISNLFSSFPSGPRKDFAVCMRKSINSKIFDHHHQTPRLALKRYALFSQSSTFFAHFKTGSSFNPRSTFFHSLVREESRMAIKINGYVKGSVSKELESIIKSVASHYGDDLDDVEPLHLVPLKGAMTNEVFQITWPTKHGGFPRKVLVRVYGEGVEVFFDRDNEIRTFEYISKHGQGPRLLSRFTQGRIEEFIHARTLSAADLRDSEISALIAAKLRDFHTIEMPFEKDVHLWKTIRKWLVTAKSLCSEKEAKEFGLETLDEEIAMLEKELPREGQEIGFCHNDLQYGNIMMDEETRAITLIDYEYSSYNPIAYDIANHFCEMVADYHSDTPHLLDYTKYPDMEERRRFVVAYLSSSGKETCDAEADELLNDAERYTLANHMFWGLWGIISDYVNNIDFDYMEYARQRFRQYRLRKIELLECPE